MADKPTSLELRPPPSPDPLLPRTDGLKTWHIVAGGAALLLLTVLIVLLCRRKKTIDPVSLRKQAYRDAVRTLDEARPPAPREAATVASLVVRRYLAIVSGDRALYETHEEFVSRHDALAKLPEPVRAATTEGFAQFAAMKYGKTTETGDPAPVIASARVLLDLLNRAFAA